MPSIRNALLIVATLVIGMSIAATGVPSANADTPAAVDFGTAIIGSPVAMFEDLVPVGQRDALDVYSQGEATAHQMGGTPVHEVNYSFYRDQLYRVEAQTRGAQNSNVVLEALRAAYGPATRTSFYTGEFWWTTPESVVQFKWENDAPHASIAIFSVPIAKQMQQESGSGLELAKDGDDARMRMAAAGH